MAPGATTAIIPNWNGEALLQRLLSGLPEQTLQFARVIVVDNGSTDDSVRTAEKLGATVIRFEQNRGFAPAVNAGVAAATTEYVAVLNNDVRLHPDWLQALATEMASGAAFACGKILQERHPDRIDGTFDTISRAGCAWRCGADRKDGNAWDRRLPIDLAPMTAALFLKSAWVSLGGLDELFESYLEDVDFGIRCASNGYSGVYQPKAIAWHLGSATRGAWHPATVRQIARNQVWLVAKHFSRRALVHNGWAIAAGQAGWGILALRNGAGLSYIRGKLEGIAGAARMRHNSSFAPDGLFEKSERQLLELQRETGFDRYWRIYSAIT